MISKSKLAAQRQAAKQSAARAAAEQAEWEINQRIAKAREEMRDADVIKRFVIQVRGSPLPDYTVLSGHWINQQGQCVSFIVPMSFMKELAEALRRRSTTGGTKE